MDDKTRAKYVTGKKVQFYPNDTYSKYGYIRDVDDLGFTYEVTESSDASARGTFFRSHSQGLIYKEVE